MHVTAFGLHRLEATAPWGVIQEKLLSRGTLFTVQKALSLFNVFVDFTNRIVGSVSLRQGLGLAAVSQARASACVSIYSRTFVNLPFRTVMAKTQWSSNVLFVALILPVAKPTTRTRFTPLRYELRGSGYEVSTVSFAF